MSKLKERLDDLMLEKDLNYFKLSKLLNFDKSAFYDLYKQNLSTTKLIKLAEFFNVEIDYLVGRSDNDQNKFKPLSLKFAANVEKLLKARNLSKAYFYKNAKISSSSFVTWKNSMPTLSTLTKVADFFDVSIDELLK